MDAVRTGAVVVLAVALVVALLRLQLMLASAHQGIDFTDEGYYLNWIAHPWAYAESVTQFGFVYHPLYLFLGEDVAKLRQANILITAFLAWVFVVMYFRATLGDDWPASYWRAWPMLALAVILATAYPEGSNMWLPTPSYNSLALQAVLVALIGLMMMDRRVSMAGLGGALLLGVGGWLAFMAKPTTCGAMAAAALAYLWGAGKLRVWSVLLSAILAAALLVGSAWLIDGSVSGFVGRLSGGIELSRLMGVEQPIWRLLRLDKFSLVGRDAWIFLALVIVVAYAVGIDFWGNVGARRQWGTLLLVSGMVAIALLIVTGALPPMLGEGQFQGMLALAPSLGAAAAALIWRLRWKAQFSRRHLSLAGLLLVMPHVFAFGTGNNYWQAGQTANLFWALAGPAILMAVVPAHLSWRVLLPVAVASQLVAAALLQVALAHPYRQPEPLRLAQQSVGIGFPRSELSLTAGYARYVVSIREHADKAGFRPGTPVIDLTGHSPGTVFALGAHASGQAWLLGGYGGSNRSAQHVLGRLPCSELAVAWLLTEENGPRKLEPEILHWSGMDISRDFEVVAQLRSPDGFGGYATGSEQKLRRPLRTASQAGSACDLARGTSK